MARLDPAIEALLHEAACRLDAAPHGGKVAIIDEIVEATGLSAATVRRRVRQFRRQGTRKRRADAGRSWLLYDEALAIAAHRTESRRKTGKQLADLEATVEALRAAGIIRAMRPAPQTGRLVPLSVSAINRALREYDLHDDQLARPAPKVSLRSLHPNHVWQIDPSLCVLYYLKREDGLHAMRHDEFYKNKPKNLARIEHDRVWRYVFTDHASGAFYVEYVLGAESAKNLCHTFIRAMQRRGDNDPFCGAPSMVMVDPGSANTAAMFKSLCAALAIDVQVNLPGQPWAKGQVEKTNDIIEREFEHQLRFARVESLDALNESAWRWMRWFQAKQAHTRHGMTRYACWQTIRPEHLRIPPSPEACRDLAVHGPQERVVSVHLRVSFRGHQYDVRDVPGIVVGRKIEIVRNAWDETESSAFVLGYDGTDQPTRFVVPRCERGEYGFYKDAVVIGERYRPHKDTPADTHRKAIERLVMGAETDEEAAAKRKAGVLPFAGRIAPPPEAPQVAYIPRRGTQLPVDAPAHVDLTVRRPTVAAPLPQLPPYSHADAARSIKPLIESAGLTWSAAMYTQTCERWPDGVPYDQIEAWADELVRRHRLTVVRERAP